MMKKFFLITLLFLATLPVTQTPAQEFEDDAELLEEAEEIPATPPPGIDENGVFENDGGAPADMGSSAAPSRFRPNGRSGNGNSSAPSRFNSPSNRTSDIGSSGVSTSNVPATGVKGKIPFMDAQPEDIHNENFPDTVESFDYKDAPISDVVNAIARLTGKRFIFEQNLNGKITIISPGKITVAEAWQTFLSSLAMNGLTVVPSGKFLKIQKMDDAKTGALDIYSGAYYPDGDQLITKIIRLKYLSAEDASKTFEKIIKSKAGQVIPYEKTNSLIVTDLGSNVSKITQVLEELDKPGFEERLHVIPIKNAKAKDIAELVDKIINKGEDKKKNTFRPASRFGAQEKNESLSLVTPDERTNSIIVVGNKEGIDRIVKLVHQLDYPLDPADAGGVYVYYVKHGEAKKIADTLNGIAQEQEKKSSSPAGTSDPNNPASFQAPKQKQNLFGGDVIIKADENTNSLIITANKQDYNTVLSLLEKMDIPRDQVFVEAYIVEMDAQKADTWSVNVLKFKGDNIPANADANTISRAGFITSANGIQTLSTVGAEGGVFGFGDGDLVSVKIGGATFSVPNLLGFIEALKKNINANVLSTPQIMAMDNEESYIEVGDEVPVAVNTAQTAVGVAQQMVQFKDATILLKLKPFISPDSDIVTLNVEQKANDISNKIPAAAQLAQSAQGIKKRTIKTNLTLKSGDVAVIGGLMQETDKLDERKIPFLGDIPVLGWLFKGRTVSRLKTNLMVFLSPKIIRNSQDHRKLTKSKYDDRIEWVKRNLNGRDPFGSYLEPIGQFANASDEFKLEDQDLPPAETPAAREEDLSVEELEDALPLEEESEN
jgi:general secretion pathway protein D